MSARIFTIIFVALGLLGLGWWWLNGDTDEPSEQVDALDMIAQDGLVQNKTEQLNSSRDADADTVETPEDNPYNDAVIKSQIMQVADLYADASRYPHFSQPILNPEEFEEPEPFDETEVDTPFPQEGDEEPIRLQLATERYQYFTGDTIRARLRVLNAKPGEFISAFGSLAGNQGDAGLSIEFQASENPAELFADFDTKLISAAVMSPEMLLKVQVQVNETPLFTTLGFRYQAAEARLVAVPWARPEGAFLEIALQYEVAVSGYYFSQAVLADLQTGKPLVQLQGEGRLQQGNDILTLRAHVQALKAVGSEGPYLLRTIRSYRGAEVGETFDKPAANLTQSYEIPGYSFDRYEDSQYVDPLAEERAEFLRQLGGVESTESAENTQDSTAAEEN